MNRGSHSPFPTLARIRMAGPTPEVVVPTLTGRAGLSQQSKYYQLFAAPVDINGVLTEPDESILEWGWQRDRQPQVGDGRTPADGYCERLFRLGSSAVVAYRSSVNNFITPLVTTEFENLPAGAVRGGNGYFRVRYRVSAARGNYVFFLDLDETIELFAFSAQAELVGPPGTLLITDRNKTDGGNPVAQLRGQVVVDARVGAMAEPTECATGLREGAYTQLVPVAAATAVRIPIPRFARAVRVFQSTGGLQSGPWTREIGITAPLNVGQIGFAGRSSLLEDAPLGRESSLLTDINGANARLFQVQWTIRP